MAKILILIAIIAVYLFDIKPQQMREDCQEKAKEQAVIKINNTIEPNETKRQQMQADYEKLILKDCLK